MIKSNVMLVESQFDSLPYLDREFNEYELAAARNLIEYEVRNAGDSKGIHQLVPEDKSTFLTPGLLEIMNNCGKMDKGVDIDKYNNLYTKSGEVDVKNAYIALAYQQSRLENLQLLAEHGKNQWLVGNDQLYYKVQQLQKTINNAHDSIEQINSERRKVQLDAKPTLDYLDERWKSSLKNLVDVNVACAELEAKVRNK